MQQVFREAQPQTVWAQRVTVTKKTEQVPALRKLQFWLWDLTISDHKQEDVGCDSCMRALY